VQERETDRRTSRTRNAAYKDGRMICIQVVFDDLLIYILGR